MPAVSAAQGSVFPSDSNVTQEPPRDVQQSLSFPLGLYSPLFVLALIVLARLVLPKALHVLSLRPKHCQQADLKDHWQSLALSAGPPGQGRARRQCRWMDRSRGVSTNIAAAAANVDVRDGETSRRPSAGQDGEKTVASPHAEAHHSPSPLGPYAMSSESTYAPAHGASPSDAAARSYLSRPPPPPPLTPPSLSSAVFTFEDRRPSYAVSIPPELDVSSLPASSHAFIHQPNPDYMSPDASTSSTMDIPSPSQRAARRTSYTKTLPIGIHRPSASQNTSTDLSTESHSTSAPDKTFSPSSYPPQSPLLPPPPPGQNFAHEQYEGDEHEVEVHGEIVSIMDDAGQGWKRHTRVYGGGVCLACAAAGGEGGFYGDRVPLKDRRR